MFEDVVRVIVEAKTVLAECPRDLTDAERIDLTRALEELKCVAAAAQVRLAVDFDASQRESQVVAGVPAARVGEGIAAQLGLARRESSNRAARLLGLAKVLQAEMPHTLALMRTGRLSEWRATIVARETGCLTRTDRATIDERLSGTGEAASLSDLALERAVKQLACELDPASVAERARRAESERYVSIRPAPDTMCWVTALLPVAPGVSVYAALLAVAATARAAGDERSRGQVMADTLIERVTGASATESPRVEVKLVMSDHSFFGGTDEAAHLAGYGPVPAAWARAFVTDAICATRAWIRRLYTAPLGGELIAMDSRARLAPAGLADFVATRDQDLCRTPWCGALIRQIAHAQDWQAGGKTTAANTQGLCQRCNLAKQAPGWSATPTTNPAGLPGRHRIEITTPTGHRHRSRAPDPPGHTAPTSPLERYVLELIA